MLIQAWNVRLYKYRANWLKVTNGSRLTPAFFDRQSSRCS